MEFKFQVGQIVTLRACLEPWPRSLVRITIIQRAALECAAGVSRVYYGRMAGEGAISNDIEFEEVELAEMPAEDPAPLGGRWRAVEEQRKMSDEILRAAEELRSAGRPAGQ